MKTSLMALIALYLASIGQALALDPVFYGGNGTTPVDSGLPHVGVIYGVNAGGDLLWYRYDGNGESNLAGNMHWRENSGNPIGNGWNNFRQILGCGDGVILAIRQDGDLVWYKYEGEGQSNRAGNQHWHANSGNVIGNGWQNFRNVFVSPREGRERSSHLTIYAVTQDGDLLWYRYDGNGESNRAGNMGWHPNSGNPIGNGWKFRHLFASGGVIFAIRDDGDLLWYSYVGNGESNRAGNTGWAANSGNPIGNGWNGFRAVFSGLTDTGGRGHVLYAIKPNGDLLWYRYNGNGESNRAGNVGWQANSSNPIGNGW